MEQAAAAALSPALSPEAKAASLIEDARPSSANLSKKAAKKNNNNNNQIKKGK
jgi:hypothetical protein